eukprot:TRINITY_DN33682_c0_g1_i1.p3 TRINITY_DN33682_c0_g1~~TRINITY_DN33682_c0_g1_i1.p3  ORF type:complete len:144 (+),score=22.42 TRINITY_DN33682_c0_g1_i1:99-530(+)
MAVGVDATGAGIMKSLRSKKSLVVATVQYPIANAVKGPATALRGANAVKGPASVLRGLANVVSLASVKAASVARAPSVLKDLANAVRSANVLKGLAVVAVLHLASATKMPQSQLQVRLLLEEIIQRTQKSPSKHMILSSGRDP